MGVITAYPSISDLKVGFVTAAIYFMIIFEASVFPEPLSPKTRVNENNKTETQKQIRKTLL